LDWIVHKFDFHKYYYHHNPNYPSSGMNDQASLNDIPYEVFVDTILPLIGLKEVGSLTMVSPVWRDMCNNQEVWRTLYMRGLAFKVTDESVVLGKCCRKYRVKKGPNSGPQSWMDHAYRSAILSQTSTTLLYTMTCLPVPLKNSLATWLTIRQDGRDDDLFFPEGGTLMSQAEYHVAFKANVQIYLDYIELEWRAYNDERGLGLVNLCQCANHYKFETLLGPTKCKDSSSFKNVVLKKQLTVSKSVAKKKKKLLRKKKEKYEKHRASAELLATELLKMEQEEEECDRLCSSLITATHV
jgi:hypothetical protein